MGRRDGSAPARDVIAAHWAVLELLCAALLTAAITVQPHNGLVTLTVLVGLLNNPIKLLI